MRSFVAIAVFVAVLAVERAAGTPHASISPRALDDASCFSCQVLFNDTARVLTDGAAAATRKALQMGLRIPEGGRLLNPEFTTTLDSDINCPHPPEACMTFSTEIALVWTNAFMFVNSGAASEASVWASTLMQDTSRWMTNVIRNFNYPPQAASGGFGAGFGFGIECGGKSILSWGTGFGGGVNGVQGQQSAGYGGGGGGQHTAVDGSQTVQDFGGGCGCGAEPDGTPVNCGSAADTNSEVLLQEWLIQGRELIQQTPECMGGDIFLCGSGGGGGGFVAEEGCPGGFGAGFGFQFAPVSLGPDLAATNASATTPKQHADGNMQCAATFKAPASAVGTTARACSTECVPQSDFNACFCPCFKSKLGAAGVTWASSISCT